MAKITKRIVFRFDEAQDLDKLIEQGRFPPLSECTVVKVVNQGTSEVRELIVPRIGRGYRPGYRTIHAKVNSECDKVFNRAVVD